MTVYLVIYIAGIYPKATDALRGGRGNPVNPGCRICRCLLGKYFFVSVITPPPLCVVTMRIRRANYTDTMRNQLVPRIIVLRRQSEYNC
jgi:hypothetical protein